MKPHETYEPPVLEELGRFAELTRGGPEEAGGTARVPRTGALAGPPAANRSPAPTPGTP
ncbi:lasso RiPP family leader peptide-containing protein [Streptomyces eurocidicus]|uniref:Lasso RiPP family leader peptide-containing protein n=1 Tax=Streptomyces eurocidicus TaxID=66423 RepID=A0A7W8F2G1_STREU|nr:lasso RiPP family leader peptide-containing protein [Streptomyces eurocidicus]MBB5119477.1 hypothetical protein [Streptomyces eurocidicus]MBF6054372.1 lasso RiPP family leader peptide-containing protein [Streptomyces eurocidicus]